MPKCIRASVCQRLQSLQGCQGTHDAGGDTDPAGAFAASTLRFAFLKSAASWYRCCSSRVRVRVFVRSIVGVKTKGGKTNIKKDVSNPEVFSTLVRQVLPKNLVRFSQAKSKNFPPPRKSRERKKRIEFFPSPIVLKSSRWMTLVIGKCNLMMKSFQISIWRQKSTFSTALLHRNMKITIGQKNENHKWASKVLKKHQLYYME